MPSPVGLSEIYESLVLLRSLAVNRACAGVVAYVAGYLAGRLSVAQRELGKSASEVAVWRALGQTLKWLAAWLWGVAVYEGLVSYCALCPGIGNDILWYGTVVLAIPMLVSLVRTTVIAVRHHRSQRR